MIHRKSIGKILIIVGAVLILLGLTGLLMFGLRGLDTEGIDGSVEAEQAQSLANAIIFNEGFTLWLIQSRVANVFAGFIVLIAGIILIQSVTMTTAKRMVHEYFVQPSWGLQLFSDICKIGVMLAFVFPFYWMLITAFKTYGESIQVPPTLWPINFSLEGYYSTFNSGLDMFAFMRNTVVVTAAVIALQLVVMVPASYAFAKRKFPLRGIFFGVVLVAFMIPAQLTYIPIYLMMADMRLINSLWPQILPFGADAFGIFMLRQSFKQIPDEIVESARLDNASEIQIMLKIMLPMCKSAMVTIAMFSFIGTWNSYFWALVMTQKDEFRPLTMAIERLRDAEVGLRWNTVMAGNSLLVIPILIVFIFASKKIIEGFTYRGVK